MFSSLLLIGALAGAMPCTNLKAMSSADMTITGAGIVPAGPYSGDRVEQSLTLPAHCRVAAVLMPSSDSHIEIEVWMPVENWNGKFQAVGNGGWAGVISYAAMALALQQGYATASTDTGHKGANAQFAVGHPEKVTDFAYRSVHEMTVKAKLLIATFYGRGSRLSYWNGCSTGGRQGMMEAQRYPDDFDGIIVGDPVYDLHHFHAAGVLRQMAMIKNSAQMVPPEKKALVANAVVAACDAKDGVKDGIVGEPESCAFDPAALLCKGTDGPNCLTSAQIESFKQKYGPVKTTSGEIVFPGSSPGFELGLPMPQGNEPGSRGLDSFRFLGRQDPNWSAMSFDLDSDLALAMKNGGDMEATDPNLAKFKARGGKLLFYHGWADPGPAPANTINYVLQVSRTLGGKQDNWLRLFLMPGVGHCRGGVGPDQADFVAALERWREASTAPDQIRASRVNGGRVDMTRPLCPYPQIAHYKGVGSTNDADNFVCKAPAKAGGSK